MVYSDVRCNTCGVAFENARFVDGDHVIAIDKCLKCGGTLYLEEPETEDDWNISQSAYDQPTEPTDG